MSGTHGRSFADLEIYQRYESLSDRLWDIVESWHFRYQKRIGDQMLDAVDSVGANIAESIGRGHSRDGCRFLFFARGSLHETEHWVRVSKRRKLIPEQILAGLRVDFVTLAKKLNAFIKKQKPMERDATVVQEEVAEYGHTPFNDNWKLPGSRSRLAKKQTKIRSQEPKAKSKEPPHA